jgi:excisionase family DNA binding protein
MTTPAAITVKDAAKRLGVHPQTVRRMQDAGKLAGFKIGRLRRISQDAITDIIQSQ